MTHLAKRYYYRTKRINGQPRRIYVGHGEVALRAAEEDRQAREARDRERADAARLRAEHAELDAVLNQVQRLADALSRAALYGTGHYQHNKGEWRRKGERGRN